MPYGIALAGGVIVPINTRYRLCEAVLAELGLQDEVTA